LPVTIATTNQRYNKTILIDLNSQYTVQPAAPFQITDVTVIQGLIYNIICTSPGEIDFEPQFGSGIAASLFDNVSASNEVVLLHNAYFSIQKFLPWVTLLTNASSVVMDQINGIVNFVLVYTISGLPGTYTSNLTLSTSQ